MRHLIWILALSGCVIEYEEQVGGGLDGAGLDVGNDVGNDVARPVSTSEPCGAGIYIGDQRPVERGVNGEFPEGTLVRQVSGDRSGVAVGEGSLIVVADGEPKRFEVDFYDDITKNTGGAEPLGLFVEAKLRLSAGAGECAAVIYLWPDRTNLAEFCLGGGRIGIALGRGNSNNLIDDLNLEQYHTYRMVVLPATLEEQGANGGEVTMFVELWIDGVRRLRLAPRDFPSAPVEQRPDRAPLLGFGSETPGTTNWDFVRWGCNPSGGPCPTDRVDDDVECETERLNTTCGGAAVAQERCDGQDNDCDGEIDEDFKRDFDEGNPIGTQLFGQARYLGDDCDFAGRCEAAVVACSDDGLGLKCDTAPFAAPERCNGRDDDCDQVVDEDFRSGPGADPENLWDDSAQSGRTRLGLDEPCGVGACEGGEVVCDVSNQDRVTCSTLDMQREVDICADGIDNNCNGEIDEGGDRDGDGYQDCPRCLLPSEACTRNGESVGQPGHDCDDDPATGVNINAGREELCNRRDDDCDGRIDEGLDLDQDGFLPCGEGDPLQPPRNVDCRDDPAEDRPGEPGARNINPASEEMCDQLDNNCNGQIDEEFSAEVDGLRFYIGREHCGGCGVDCQAISQEKNTILRCEVIENEVPIDQYGCSPLCRDGFIDANQDILSQDPNWHQGSDGCECELDIAVFCDDPNGANCAERCDDIDNDCDGLRDEGEDIRMPACYNGPPHTRNQGICQDGRIACRDGRGWPEICVGEVTPVTAVERQCDGLDENCNGVVDEAFVLTENGLPVLGDDGLPIYSVEDHCGGCNQRCAPPNAQPLCNRGSCQVLECRRGFFDIDGRPENGCEYNCVITGREVCDGLDNDCNDRIDESFDLQTDPNNCGQCGRRCGMGVCQNGQCP